jgi:hypothetical protein
MRGQGRGRPSLSAFVPDKVTLVEMIRSKPRPGQQKKLWYLEEKTLQPLENPFGPKLLPMS